MSSQSEVTQEVEGLPRVVRLPMGLIGFSEFTEFSLQSAPGCPPFLLLQARGEGAPEFVVMQPEGVIGGYELFLSDEDCESLDLGHASEALVLNIVTIRSMTPPFVTVNLAGPVIVNRKSGRGKQIICTQGTRYSTEYVLVDQRTGDKADREKGAVS
jgi:flagellar assembly factor FliW